ncbi:MAG: GNAT family N-acetyltransferase [Anaerolineae bacterium]
MTVRPCAFCGARAQYRDRATGDYVCLVHARLAVVAAGQGVPGDPLAIRRAGAADSARIEELALYFWDETVVDCFDRQYDVMACPAFVACDGEDVVGAAVFAVEEAWSALVLVMLNVLPGFQGRGGGRSLLDALRQEARQRGLDRILVVTTNDDLPALALYQRYGFRIAEIVVGRVATDHAAGRDGQVLAGFAGIPVRDEIRLELRVASQGA